MQIKEIYRQLKDQGIKLTNQRKELLQILVENQRPISAEEIFLLLQEVNPNSCLATIYRNLDLLVNLGLVRQLQLSDKKRKYELTDEEHYHYLVCLGCSKTVKLDDCPISVYQDQVIQETQFTITEHRFSMYGYCPECNDEESGQSTA